MSGEYDDGQQALREETAALLASRHGLTPEPEGLDLSRRARRATGSRGGGGSEGSSVLVEQQAEAAREAEAAAIEAPPAVAEVAAVDHPVTDEVIKRGDEAPTFQRVGGSQEESVVEPAEQPTPPIARSPEPRRVVSTVPVVHADRSAGGFSQPLQGFRYDGATKVVKTIPEALVDRLQEMAGGSLPVGLGLKTLIVGALMGLTGMALDVDDDTARVAEIFRSLDNRTAVLEQSAREQASALEALAAVVRTNNRQQTSIASGVTTLELLSSLLVADRLLALPMQQVTVSKLPLQDKTVQRVRESAQEAARFQQRADKEQAFRGRV